MNIGRIISGGVVAGTVMNVIDYVINVLFLGERWAAALQSRSIDPASVPLGGAGWVIVDFVAGILIVWLYAAINPRFGRGPSTSLIAAVIVWIIGHAMFSSLWFLGGFPISLIASSSLGAIISSFVAGLAGCGVYKEKELTDRG